MADERIYFREWRKHRHMTQDQVVNRLAIHEDTNMPATTASLSRLENGKQPYSPRILNALADIYDCETWELIGRNPLKEGAVIDMVRRLDERKQAQIAAFIKALEAG
jgi:transcriptional regulator with XRE-family HTH domain